MKGSGWLAVHWSPIDTGQPYPTQLSDAAMQLSCRRRNTPPAPVPPPPNGVIVLVQTWPNLDGTRSVAFADGSVKKIRYRDFTAVWATNNAVRVSLGLAPLPLP